MKYKKYIDEHGNEIYEEIKDESELFQDNEPTINSIRSRAKMEEQAELNMQEYMRQENKRIKSARKKNAQIIIFWSAMAFLGFAVFMLALAGKVPAKISLYVVIGSLIWISFSCNFIRKKYR